MVNVLRISKLGTNYKLVSLKLLKKIFFLNYFMLKNVVFSGKKSLKTENNYCQHENRFK